MTGHLRREPMLFQQMEQPIPAAVVAVQSEMLQPQAAQAVLASSSSNTLSPSNLS
jgi:hypothetical protein